MSLVDFSDFERQGKIETDIRFTDLQEAKSLLDKLFSDALTSIDIFTPDMESDLYNDENIIHQILNFARGNRHARIQILTFDTSHAIRDGHRLIQLARNLSTAINIRIATEEYQSDCRAFILVDKSGFIFRPDIKTYQGIYNADCKIRSHRLDEVFTQAWEHAEPDPQTRNIYI